jgi:hypothetical protein
MRKNNYDGSADGGKKMMVPFAEEGRWWFLLAEKGNGDSDTEKGR